MKNKILAIVAAFVAVVMALGASSCKKQADYSGCKAPVMALPMEEIHPDLNRVDNTPIVCVIFSEAGLETVKVYISKGEEESLFQTFTTFQNLYQYSLKATPNWTADMTQVRIEAIDRGGKTAEATMTVEVTPILPAPVVVFSQDKIVIDEFKGDDPSIETGFTVTSSNTIASITVKLFRASGTVDVPLTPSLKPASDEYTFSQVIDYMEGDRGLQVAATDANGKLHIETLPVQYIPAPSPIITPTGSTSTDPLKVRHDESREFTFNITSETGLSAVQAFKVTKDETGKNKDELLNVQYFNPESDFDVEYSYTFDSFDPASFQIKFVATDRLNHSTNLPIVALVDMRLGENIVLSSQYNAKNPLIFDGSTEEYYCFFSVRDFKTYSLFYFWNPENRRNIDFFYFAVYNSGQKKDVGARLMRSNEERSGQDTEFYLAYTDPEDSSKNIPELGTGNDWGGRNVTLIKRLPNTYTFNFDNATVADLTTPQVNTLLNQPKQAIDWYEDMNPGSEYLFKTGSLSTCPNCVGIMRVESIVGSKTDFGKSPVYFEISIKAQVID